MAVIAYAAGVPNPKVNQDDPVIDLSSVALPQVVNLYGDAFDTNNPGNLSWDWSWTILDNDAASPATLSDPAVQNPTLTVNTWRNVRLFLIVTNTNTSETSETDPLLAPDSAFVNARVLSTELGLQKIAGGARNNVDPLHEWPEAIEGLAAAGVPSHDLIDHQDVVSTTGPQLDILSSGAYAEDPPGTPLHTHKGDAIDVATDSALGVVQLEEASATPATPKVLTQERVILDGTAEVTITASGPIVGVAPFNYPGSEFLNSGHPICLWRVEEDLVIKGFAVSLRDGGPAAPTTSYNFGLVKATKANAETLTWTTFAGLATLTGAPPSDNAPLLLNTVAGSTFTVAAGEYLALVCLNSPKHTEGDNYGGGLSAQIYCRRRVI